MEKLSDESKELVLDEILSEVDKNVVSMKLGKSINVDAVNTLYSFYHRAKKDEIKSLIGDRLAKRKIGVVFKKFWKLLKNETGTKLLIQKACWNYTHVSEDLCEHFGRSGFLQVLISDLEFFSNEQGKDEVLTSLMAIIFNCAKIPLNAKYFKKKDILRILHEFTSFENKTIKMVAILTLSYVVDDENNSLITADDSVIKNIIQHLKHSIQDAQHKSEGWSAFELVDGLIRLASNSDNSAKIAEEDVVGALMTLIENGRGKEQEVAGEALWMLCFNEKTKQTLLENENYMEILRRLGNADGESGTAIKGILWFLNHTTQSEQVQNKAKKGQIMISYQWDNQEVLDRVYEELTKLGYDIWMDIHDMAGSILEAMAEAVEGSEVILVCMSQKYKNSPNCRTEAEYAFNLRKKIVPLKLEEDYKADGWLGAMVGTKLYTDFSKLQSLQGESFQKKISKLVLEIDNSLSNEEEQLMKSVEKVTLDGDVSKPSSITKPTENVDAEVDEWKAKNNISSPKIAELSMEELKFLRGLMVKAPEVYYNYLSDKLLREDLVEMMKISNALHAL